MKAILLDVIVGVVLIATEVLFEAEGNPIRPYLVITMVLIPLYGLDLGGASSTMRADMEPLLARFGVRAIGNIALAGSMRIELLNGDRELSYNRELCKGCRSCEELCPQGVWDIDESKRAVLAHKKDCTACLACLVQCESGAIRVPRAGSMAA